MGEIIEKLEQPHMQTNLQSHHPLPHPNKTSAIFSPEPIISPPIIAPGIEVNPPKIRTGRAFKAISANVNWTPSLDPQRIPAAKPTIPATDQTIVQIVFNGIPTESAAW